MTKLNSLQRPRAILFDMDGVLVDSEELHWSSVLLLLQKKLGQKAPSLEPRVGWGDEALWSELIASYSLEGTPRSLTIERGLLALQLLKQTPPPQMAGALEAIRSWKRADPKLKLAVVSASPKDQMIQSLLHFTDERATPLFDLLISGVDDTKVNKPHPAPYLLAMQTLQLQPQDCWIAEDSTTGLTAGLASGAHTFPVGAHTVAPDLISKCQKELNTLLDLFFLWEKASTIST